MRTIFRALFLVLLAAGCAQLKKSGRFQEVLVTSKPLGAAISIEGLSVLSGVAAIKDGKHLLLFSSQATLTTPAKLILDKERTYTIHLRYEDKKKTIVLKPHFAFHPYLIVLFPVVPFVVDYDVKRFDDVVVDFTEKPKKKPQKEPVKKQPAKPKKEEKPAEKPALKKPAPKKAPGEEKTPPVKEPSKKKPAQEKSGKKESKTEVGREGK